MVGKEDCYMQYVAPGATFYVSFQVSADSASAAVMLLLACDLITWKCEKNISTGGRVSVKLDHANEIEFSTSLFSLLFR